MFKLFSVLCMGAALSLASICDAAPIWKKIQTFATATEGAACNPTTDKAGITTGNQILSCQSGVWTRSSIGLQRAHGLASSWPSGFVCNTSAGSTLFLAVQLYGGVLYFDVPYSYGNYIGVSTANGNIVGQSGSAYYCAAAVNGTNLFSLISAASLTPVY